MLALAIPLYLFYELAIVFGRLYNRRRRKRREKEQARELAS
jgi:Sec-independent protein secretion pathway component TatC